MAKKLSFMKWYPADWINDTRTLSPEAKGCYIDILCLMWNASKRGVWEGTYQEFSRATGIAWENAPGVLIELKKVVNLTESNNILTLKNRRMIKQETAYENNRIKQKKYYEKHKPNPNLTDKTLDVRLKMLDVIKDKDKITSFSKPTFSQVSEYAKSIGFKLDGGRFCDYYESKGWKIGNTPMKSWQAAVRTWHRKFREDNPNASNGSESITDWTTRQRAKIEAEKARTKP